MIRNSLVVLDRDGVINKDFGHVHSRENFEFMPGIFELCTFFMEQDIKIVVATNQSGIGRKMYTEQQFKFLTDWMLEEFRKRNIEIQRVYWCPHAPIDQISSLASQQEGCLCRKPNPGMLLQALREFNSEASDAIIVGDKETDMLAGLNAGFQNRILIGLDDESRNNTKRFPDLFGALEYFRGKLSTNVSL